jgi:hypothetical protein
MSDAVIERLERLKQGLDDLGTGGVDDPALFELRSEIARLSLAVIVSDLEEEDASYVSATLELDGAIESIEAAKEDMASVATAIRAASTSVALVEKALEPH